MSKWNLVIDVAYCTNCNLCTLALMDEYIGNDFPGYAAGMPEDGPLWLRIEGKERGTAPMIDIAYLPRLCNHCDDAPCIAAAENDAIKKREDGIVIIDPQKAVGQKQLVEACPYGAIHWNEARQLPQHWIFDAHLLDNGWAEPRCVTVCASGAMRSLKVDDAEMQRIAADEGLEVLGPELNTKPRVYYKNLHRFTKCFVGGSVVAERDGVVDCVEDAVVTLSRGDEAVAETRTDNYGDFRFDRLDEDSGAYTVSIRSADGVEKTLPVELGVSRALGKIML